MIIFSILGWIAGMLSIVVYILSCKTFKQTQNLQNRMEDINNLAVLANNTEFAINIGGNTIIKTSVSGLLHLYKYSCDPNGTLHLLEIPSSDNIVYSLTKDTPIDIILSRAPYTQTIDLRP